MYKVTCFASVASVELGESLKGFKVKAGSESIEWDMDKNYTFRIEPFKTQPYGRYKGYRTFFNCSIRGGAYLFDSAFGWTDKIISSIEYDMFLGNFNRNKCIHALMNDPSYKLIDSRGLFMKGRIIVVVLEDKINLQIRARKSKSLKLLECLTELEKFRKEFTPNRYDLFSFQKAVSI